MANAVNVDFITKVVEIEVDDNKPESLAALAAINAAQRAEEAKQLVLDEVDNTLAAIDAKTEEEKDELDVYTDDKKADYLSQAETILDAVREEYGYPFVAETAADMTDVTKIYVYTGSEEDYTPGNWYYHNGTSFVSGGVFNEGAKDLKADIIDTNSFDRLKHLTRTGRTLNGITFTWNTDGSCTVTGTSTSTSLCNMYLNSSKLAEGFKKGERYVLIHQSEKIRVEMYKYVNGSLVSGAFLSTTSNASFTIPNDAEGMLIRIMVTSGQTVNETINPICINADSIYMLYRQALINFGTSNQAFLRSSDADTMRENTLVFVSRSGVGEVSIANVPYAPGFLITLGAGTYTANSYNSAVQLMIPWNWKNGIMIRTKQSGVWSDWRDSGVGDALLLPTESDLDDLVDTAKYLLASGSGFSYINAPTNAACYLEVNKVILGDGGSNVIQLAYGWGDDTKVYRRTKLRDLAWSAWTIIGGGGGDTYNTTQNITQVQNTNTYSGSVSPTITTDSNGWLQPIDTESESETGKTDMTPSIMAMLNSTGYCHLAPGIFYVSGNIDMPAGSMLEGCGRDTIVRLLATETEGYCVSARLYNTIRGIRFSGGYNEFDPSTADIGGRNGINFVANSDGSPATVGMPCIIENCYFENFDGNAVYCDNTGGSTNNSLTMSNCYIQNCEAGVNLDYKVEYSKFTNVITRKCYYACINNGGNNVFTGCTFHGTIGFLIDNSSETKSNNAHGSVVGCTFNHIDNWNRPETLGMGEAIKIIGPSTAGFIFTGCQIWYGSINVNNAKGISFTNCLIGGNTPEINVENNATAFFANCVFRQTPDLNVLTSTKFDNCYLSSDGSAITN